MAFHHHHVSPGLTFYGAILFGEAAVTPASDGVEAWLKAAMYIAGVVVAVLVVWEKIRAFREGARKEGDEYARKADHDAFKADHDKLADYVHESIHDLRDKINATNLKLEVVKTQQDGLSSKIDQVISANIIQTQQLARLMTLTELRIDRQRMHDIRHEQGHEQDSGKKP